MAQLDQCSETWIRERLVEAVGALRRLPGPSLPSGYPNVWPDYRHEQGDIWWAEGWGLRGGVRVQRAGATQEGIAAIDQVLPWLYAIEDIRYRKAAFLRAIPLGWQRVGKILGVSHETARRWEKEAVQIILVYVKSA